MTTTQDINTQDQEELNTDDQGEAEGFGMGPYEITSSPNDFSISTIFNFIQSGTVIIPEFQRHYVWDIKRGSKLIESLLIGLPIPQIFLYEEARNRFLVIDGQQRLLTIYYFKKGRFPRPEKRSELRKIFSEHGLIPDEVIHDDTYFRKFNLSLDNQSNGSPNPFHGKNYETLDEYQTTFDLRTIRNIIIKQTSPHDDESSTYEIFYRLNTGGVNLRPQEIRMCLHHKSDFYKMLARINTDTRWRRLLGQSYADLRYKDIEVLLRTFAMLVNSTNYRAPMNRFLNEFSRIADKWTIDETEYYASLFGSFMEHTTHLEDNTFRSYRSFQIALFEAVFTAVCEQYAPNRNFVAQDVSLLLVQQIQQNKDFSQASQEGIAEAANVKQRLDVARSIFGNDATAESPQQ